MNNFMCILADSDIFFIDPKEIKMKKCKIMTAQKRKKIRAFCFLLNNRPCCIRTERNFSYFWHGF